MNFLRNLDKDLQKALLIQLRNLWTHTSTAIEGNTLTLGETAFVLEEGLTIAGKPLKDHQEVVGHARAIDLVYDCLEQGRTFTEADLFALHRRYRGRSSSMCINRLAVGRKNPILLSVSLTAHR
jgi:Fic family protein